MAGVFFVVCVPTANHEKVLRKKDCSAYFNIDSNKPIKFFDDLKGRGHFETRNCNGGGYYLSERDVTCNQNKSTDILGKPNLPDKEYYYTSKNYSTRSAENVTSGANTDYKFLKSSLDDIKNILSPKKHKLDSEAIKSDNDTNMFEVDTPLETILSEVLERLGVIDAVWCSGKENKHYQVFFSLESGVTSEEAIQLLASFGIGTQFDSVVSVIPCALYYHGNQSQNTNGPEEKEFSKKRPQATTAWSRFVSSVRARTTLAQVVHDVKTEAALTFDWLFLLIVAALVAAIGLVENSTVILVASMLISPLMGPITASTMGTAVKDRSLQRMGVLHELFGLFLCLVIGFLFGLIICCVDEKYGDGEWPTYEMMSRCELRSLWVGLLVALPSGAGVALAVLGENTPSLVGVAISASLLPPAVNAGLFWAMALIQLIFLNDDTRFSTVVKTAFYSDNPACELAVQGSISLCLTLINIICIFIAGVLVYKIKEVAPMQLKNTQLWKPTKQETSQEEPITPRAPTEPSYPSLDYLRWLSMEQHSRLMRAHATWSPHARPKLQPLPSAQDIEHFCKQQSRFSKQLGDTANSVYKANGQNYTPLASESSLVSDEIKPNTGKLAFEADLKAAPTLEFRRNKFTVTIAKESRADEF